MARDTDHLRAANALQPAQARHDAGGPADYHIAQADLCMANLKRAHSAGVPGSARFEADQAVAHLRAVAGLAAVQELLTDGVCHG